MKRYALISVYDKKGIVDFAKVIKECGYGIISTGNTARILREAGLEVIEVSEYTGFPEILDGRVKTLNPKVFAGILFDREKEEHTEVIKNFGFDAIDIVVVNLYPFNANPSIEMIDIGGLSLVRASAKNYRHVLIVVDPKDYGWVGERLKRGELTVEDRRRLAVKAFMLTSIYDSNIANWLSEDEGVRIIAGKRTLNLRYGENPHQRGMLYSIGDFGFGSFKQYMGKPLSYNNILDADSGYRLILEFEEPAVCIIKHGNPCGAAIGGDIYEAYEKAYKSDPISAYGGIVVANRVVERELARRVVGHFYEVLLAPGYTNEALEVLGSKPNLRVIEFGDWGNLGDREFRSVSGALLVQDVDRSLYESLEVVSERKPEEKDIKELIFAFKVVKHVRSNAIVFTKEGQLIGLGAGQVSRVDSVKIAGMKARELGHNTSGAYMASDAFFPFPDGIEVAHSFGIRAVIQPGGSIRDEEVIRRANELGIIMVLTGMRHFRH
ncbi:MAG: bifunctional phosphoribosylaminoimidazolecarboxamide formyltransferase/IMP cyclohydrolase [Thermosulfidibacteraceae bacterium]|jgi:phosphoribosylaminoimidazolecarboxamide formyltransferase/IMP cyclohydrolase